MSSAASLVAGALPMNMKLNSSLAARPKKIAFGIASTLVLMPTRVSICATASSILASLR